jgi:hypothetical protein
MLAFLLPEIIQQQAEECPVDLCFWLPPRLAAAAHAVE